MPPLTKATTGVAAIRTTATIRARSRIDIMGLNIFRLQVCVRRNILSRPDVDTSRYASLFDQLNYRLTILNLRNIMNFSQCSI